MKPTHFYWLTLIGLVLGSGYLGVKEYPEVRCVVGGAESFRRMDIEITGMSLPPAEKNYHEIWQTLLQACNARHQHKWIEKYFEKQYEPLFTKQFTPEDYERAACARKWTEECKKRFFPSDKADRADYIQ